MILSDEVQSDCLGSVLRLFQARQAVSENECFFVADPCTAAVTKSPFTDIHSVKIVAYVGWNVGETPRRTPTCGRLMRVFQHSVTP